MKGLWVRTPKKNFLEEGTLGSSIPQRCSGPGSSGLADAALGGTGGHPSSSGLAGKEGVGAPKRIFLSFRHP